MTYEEEVEEYRSVIKFLETTIEDQERVIKEQDETISKLDQQIKLMAEESFAKKEIVKGAIKNIREIKNKIRR